jgi:putative ABC transport system substrate-binding protein
MKRRYFPALFAGAAICRPRIGRAQQVRVPVIGFLRSSPAAGLAHLVTAFRDGLKETGLVEGENVAVEYRFADNQLDQLPALVADLIHRHVAVIVCNHPAANAAKVVTSSIPIVFVSGEDPIKTGLVTSLNRPGGNLTGVTFFSGSQLGAKRLELLSVDP